MKLPGLLDPGGLSEGSVSAQAPELQHLVGWLGLFLLQPVTELATGVMPWDSRRSRRPWPGQAAPFRWTELRCQRFSSDPNIEERVH